MVYRQATYCLVADGALQQVEIRRGQGIRAVGSPPGQHCRQSARHKFWDGLLRRLLGGTLLAIGSGLGSLLVLFRHNELTNQPMDFREIQIAVKEMLAPLRGGVLSDSCQNLFQRPVGK
jgi:hypothetical protein